VSRSARAGDAAMFVSALASAQSDIKLLVGSHAWTTQSCGMQFKTFLDKRIKTHELLVRLYLASTIDYNMNENRLIFMKTDPDWFLRFTESRSV
jgi:hypothetical protein